MTHYIPSGVEYPANTSSDGQQENSVVAGLAGGGFVVVWYEYSVPGSVPSGIRAQMFDSEGAPVGGATLVGSSFYGYRFHEVTPLASGGFVVTWYDQADGDSIKAQLFDASGDTVGDAILVSNAPEGFLALVGGPVVTDLGDGGFLVVWSGNSAGGGDTSGLRIAAQMFDASGEKIGEEFLVNTKTEGDQLRPSVTVLEDGQIVIVWQDRDGTDGTGPVSVKGQMLAADCTKIGGEFSVWPDGSLFHGAPEVVALANSGFVIAWTGDSGQPARGNDVFAQVYDNSGAKVGDEILVNTSLAGNQSTGGLVALPEGGFAVTWTDYSGAIDDPDPTSVRMQVFDASGNKIAGELLVPSATVSDQYQSSIGVLANGDVVVTWTGTDEFGPYAGEGIRARIFIPGPELHVGTVGADQFSGRLGDDTYVVNHIDDIVIELENEGVDTIETALGAGDSLQTRRAAMYQLTAANVEILTGTSDLGQGLRGNSGDNIVNAAAGDDYIDLTDGGSDDVNSGDGRDVLYYGSALDGGDANDAGDEGGDTRGDLLVVQGDYSAGLTLGAEALIDIEKFRVLKAENTSFGHDGTGLFSYNITTVDANVAAGGLLVVQGGSLQPGETLTFDGSAETDGSFKLFGGRDDDTLIGGAQGDHILGRAGEDVITGNGGNDRIRGGLGADTLDGGEGADVFVYAPLPNEPEAPYTNAALESTSLDYDTILGFTFGEDRIDLPQTVTGMAELLAGSLSNATFDADLAAAVDSALAADGAVLFTADGGDHAGATFLIVDGDNDGSYQAGVDYVIQLDAPVGTMPANVVDLFV